MKGLRLRPAREGPSPNDPAFFGHPGPTLPPLVVRAKCAAGLRRFPPIGRATKQFERLYKGRTAVERVNARLKIFWGVDDGNVVGARRFHAHVGVVMVVHAALALWLAKQERWEGTLGGVSVSPIAQALARLDKEQRPEPLPELASVEPGP